LGVWLAISSREDYNESLRDEKQMLEEKIVMQRFGQILGVKKDKMEKYKEYHRNVWPEVLHMIAECNIQNYSIFLRKLPDGKHYLFSYFEYTGSDWEADSAKMDADPKTQEWWAINGPCQEPLESREKGEWWAGMEEIFHVD
jgi:L-rhamnose mutarotase